jgi:hypothetical protein
MLRPVKREYRKRLKDCLGVIVLGDYELRRYVGQLVTVTAHYGPFRVIRTNDGVVFYGVGKGLLEKI